MIERRSIASLSTCAGSTLLEAWTSTTRLSSIRCSWTCERGFARSERPNRIFEAALEVARSAGLVGRKRVLDSTALYDAVATQDTVTLIRSAIRALLKTVDEALAAELFAVLKA